jgi:transposase
LAPEQVYPSDLTDAQGERLGLLLTRERGPGHPRLDGPRTIVDAMRSLRRSL